MRRLAIGIDIGGMSFKAAFVDKDGYIQYKYVHECKTRSGNDEFVRHLKHTLDHMINYAKENDIEIIGAGVGVPGLVNSRKNEIISAVNVNVEFLSINDALAEYRFPIKISDDANLACLAEAKAGAARGVDNVILLTLGTGVGGGIIINGKIYEGTDGQGAELGHMVIVSEGEICGCGRRGCLEAYASATALLRYTTNEMFKNPRSLMWDLVEKDISKVTGKTSFDAAKSGDPDANRVIDTYVRYLATGIMNYANIFRPELFLLGGGISNQGDYLIDKIKKYCEKYSYGMKNSIVPDIKAATLKNDAGVIGAAMLMF